MSNVATRRGSPGPFRADQVHEGDHYELSDGHAIWCGPTGGDGARRTGAAFEALDTDPAVTEAGVDAGFSPTPGSLRAPDVSVGNVPDGPGWITGVPPLAVEYAGTGQDHADLADKISELLAAGTRFVWVVHLVGPRRVEVFERDAGAPRIVGPGELLHAPGVLKNPVPVEALWDRSAAHEVALRNLLERRGYADLDAVRHEGLDAGLAQGRAHGELVGLRAAVRDLCETLDLGWTPEREQVVDAMSRAEIDELRAVLKTTRRWPEA